MDGELTDRAPFGASLLVAIGWFAAVVLAVILGTQTLPDQPREPDQCGWFACLSTSQEITLGLFFAAPVLAGLVVVSALLLLGVRRVVWSPLVAGTLSAAGAVLVAGCVLASLGQVRIG